MNLFTYVLFVLVSCIYADINRKDSWKRRVRRDTVRDDERKWPNGVVPYVFAFGAGLQTRSAFKSAISEIEKVSCVRFVKRKYQKDYVKVITGDGCYSIIGRDGGEQNLSLGSGCYRKGIAIHEVMHVLGFFHEQSRLDRDKHVAVFYNNALLDSRRQFKKYKPYEGDTLNEPYDPDSIMHYGNKAFSRNGASTILFRKDITKKLGQRNKLSDIDKIQLNKLYRCSSQSRIKTERPPVNQTETNLVVEIDTCRDDPWSSFSGQCLFQSFMGSCFRSPQRMSYLCPRTCGFCRPTCIDTSEYCRFFSRYGYCQSNKVVRKRCKKTCKLCRTV